MKYTQYFLYTRQRQDRKNIKLEWIETVAANPEYEVLQSDGRIRRWARIQEADDRYLRVVLLEDRLMEIKYFSDTDTLLINFNDKEIAETKDLNENVLIELDGNGGLVSMTIEHAKQIANINDFLYQQVAG